MKPGYKRLIIFIFCLLGILLINSFFFNFLSGYRISILIFALLAFFHCYYVFEKKDFRHFYDILFEIFVFVMSFFIIYYLFGIIVGLAKTVNYFTIRGIFIIILPLVLYIILREILRYNLLLKADDSKIISILVVVLFVMFDLTNTIYYANLNSEYATFRFTALSLLPVISSNIAYSYISKKTGYIPVVVFDLIMVLYPYLLPIIPNPSEYVVSVIKFIIPVLFALRIRRFFNRYKDDFIPSNYRKKRYIGLFLPAIIIIVLVYLYSGYFRYYAIAIGSGSMEPKIKKGDVVIVNQKTSKFEVDDVIAFKESEYIIVHRIVNIVKVGNEEYYYTKGDANQNIDDFVVDKKSIIGKVYGKVPYVGYPTVWLGEK